MSIQFAKGEITSIAETIEKDVPDKNTENQNSKETTTSNVPDNVPDRFSDKRLNMIMRLISMNSRITATEIAELLKVSNKTAKRDIAKLKEQGAIKRVGKEKGGHWEIL
jgi:predicted HTH transcriptional regulator